jgi:hypothetical protein
MQKITVIYGDIVFFDNIAMVCDVAMIETITANTLEDCQGIAEQNSGFYGGDYVIPEIFTGIIKTRGQ